MNGAAPPVTLDVSANSSSDRGLRPKSSRGRIGYAKVRWPERCLEPADLAIPKVIDDEHLHGEVFATLESPERKFWQISLRMKVHVCFHEYVILVLQYYLGTQDIPYAILQTKEKFKNFVLASKYTFERTSFERNVVRAEFANEFAMITRIVCL